MAGVQSFGQLQFHTIEPDELALALAGWLRHTMTPEGKDEAPVARSVTLKLVGILPPHTLPSLISLAQHQRCDGWVEWILEMEGRRKLELAQMN